MARRRDGTPVPVEDIIAAQQAGQLPPPPPEEGVAPEILAVAAMLAAAQGGSPPDVPVVAPIIATAAVGAATSNILSAFDGMFTERRADMTSEFVDALGREAPDLHEQLRQNLAAEEASREQEFAAKARLRLDRDVRDALSDPDPEQRKARLDAILARERRYVDLREQAIGQRARGAANAASVELASPEGGYWRRNPASDSCDLCRRMDGKVWPWSVLHPVWRDRHLNCACKLHTIDTAVRMGWARPEDFQSVDDAIVELAMQEHAWDPDDLDADMALLEAAYDRRWARGTTKAGEFRPRRGGVVGIRAHRPHHRGGRARPPASPVPALSAELDVSEIATSDLKVGDHVLVNGALDEVTEVKGNGVFVFRDMGMAYIDRATVRGVAHDQRGPGAPPPAPEPPAPEPPHPTPGPGAPAPAPTGGPTFSDIEAALLTRTIGSMPTAPVDELVAGFAYLGKGDKVSYKRELRDGGVLALPDGFFRQGRDRREAIIWKHLGGKLTQGLGDSGLAALAGQDDHLASAPRVSEVYYALNVDGARERMVDLHPDAARLVATAAHERGLPLHPEAAKLATQPAVADVAPADHPAHGLAKRVTGLTSAEAEPLLSEAGYRFVTLVPGADQVRLAYRSQDDGATITATFDSKDVIVATDVHVEPDQGHVSEGERKALTKALDVVHERLGLAGYASNIIRSGDWLQWVHPDGRGRAVKIVEAGATADVIEVKAFTPTEREVAQARERVLLANPLEAIRVGDDAGEVRKTLDRPGRWRVSGEGASYVTFGIGEDRVTIHHDAGKVTAVGRADPRDDRPGQIISAADYEQWKTAQQDEAQRLADERVAAEATIADTLKDVVGRGDEAGLLRTLAGRTPNQAVSLLQSHGYQLRARRRSRQGGVRKITYTLRGPNAETVKVTGPMGFSQPADRVAIEGNPQAGRRQRLPAGTAPRNLDELLVDALGRADELGVRYDAGVNVTGIVQGGVSSGAAAHHEWNGTIAVRKSGEGRRIKAYLAQRAKGSEPLTERDHLIFYNDLETIQHEINHGVAKRGAHDGGLSFGPEHYRGAGKAVEEALTEETAHLLTVDWLRSHGMVDVLAAVKSNPNHHHVLGTYQEYRVQLRRILDDAHVPENERADLLVQMKFQMTPEERNAELIRLAGATTLGQAMRGPTDRASRDRAREMRLHFDPILRPDMSDIEVPPLATTAEGRELVVGDEIMVVVDGHSVAGRVLAVGDGIVKVRTEDGVVLWYPVERVH